MRKYKQQITMGTQEEEEETPSHFKVLGAIQVTAAAANSGVLRRNSSGGLSFLCGIAILTQGGLLVP